jgi:hypothetical protein
MSVPFWHAIANTDTYARDWLAETCKFSQSDTSPVIYSLGIYCVSAAKWLFPEMEIRMLGSQ